MTEATGYLGKREFHGALARHSPYWIRSVLCVVCGRRFESACEIADELCHGCWRAGWRRVCAWCLAGDCAIGLRDGSDWR